MDEKGILMAVMLKAVNKRYLKGAVAHVDARPELAEQERKLEEWIHAVWSEDVPIEKFKITLREYYDFWLIVIKEFNVTSRKP